MKRPSKTSPAGLWEKKAERVRGETIACSGRIDPESSESDLVWYDSVRWYDRDRSYLWLKEDVYVNVLSGRTQMERGMWKLKWNIMSKKVASIAIGPFAIHWIGKCSKALWEETFGSTADPIIWKKDLNSLVPSGARNILHISKWSSKRMEYQWLDKKHGRWHYSASKYQGTEWCTYPDIVPAETGLAWSHVFIIFMKYYFKCEPHLSW